MVSRAAKAAIVAAVVAVAAYWYWSPLIAMRGMRAAAEKRDADAFNDYVEYAKLRESLKGQFSALMMGKLASAGQSGSDAERAGAALGSAFGLAMLDRFVDAMVRPEAVMRLMNEAKLSPKATEPAADSSSGDRKANQPRWAYERKGTDKVLVRVADEDVPNDKKVSIVFERVGFAGWKLTEVRLPQAGN